MSDVFIPGLASATPVQAAAPMMPLRVRDLSLTLNGVSLLRDITLDLGPGGCTMILGPNGAGKSLLLRVLHGLIPATSGSLDWNGHSPEAATLRQALVFQKPVLLRRSVAANVDFVLKTRRKDRRQVHALLDHVGLAHKAGQPARLLSGGEQQRLALVRALATDPDMLFLDEPTASLDPASGQAIEQIVRDARRRGVRIVFVTHDIGQARRLADDIVFLHQGQVATHCRADAFFDHPPCQAAKDYLHGHILT